MQSDPIHIPASRTKVSLATFGSLGFVVLGIALFVTSTSIVVSAVGIMCTVVFGCFVVLGVIDFFGGIRGLTIDIDGIDMHSSMFATVHIPWQTIEGIRRVHVNAEPFVAIDVVDTDAVFSNASRLRRMLMKANVNLVGSPYAIGSQSLQIDSNALYELLFDAHKALGNQT
ncbi:MAG: STM3941 family protein [Planctomycetota bacterium]